MIRISLFWRTFLLVSALVLLSLLVAGGAARLLDKTPPEQRLAWEISSVVNLTRSALVSSQAERRAALLDDLIKDEGVRIALLEPDDVLEPLPGTADASVLAQALYRLLGDQTRLAGRLNGVPGLWVSFNIDDDQYWLGMRLERWTRQAGPPLWLIATLTLVVGMLGALLISRLVNRPLARLGAALGKIAAGVTGPELAEEGPSELAELNRHFNLMSRELASLESDRAVALAGISHDIRTPLTRLRIEIELSAIAESDRESMCADIERIDRIVAKFVEYARSTAGEVDSPRIENVDVGSLVSDLRRAYLGRIEAGEIHLELQVDAGLVWRGDPMDLLRVLANLLENAMRHGRLGSDPAHVTIRASRGPAPCPGASALLIEVLDQGPGVPDQERERLLRPFARLQTERDERGGSGLGLAIVQRIAQRYRGACTLENLPPSGLSASVWLQDTPQR
jgi:two-component system osmolarity sensor histidine kinase EnvZ